MDLMVGDHVILGTPTGSGKSLVALGMHFMALATGRRAYYTAPIKALVSEKFFDLVDILGRENVGMITGDAHINAEAPVICCTAEILANQALREGVGADVGCVAMDEFHFYGDADRGWAWQVPLLTLPKTQFLLMSATLGDVSAIAASLKERTGTDVDVVADAPRPVPLEYEYVEMPLEGTVELALRKGEAPLYLVHFSQDAALATAQALSSYGVASKEQREQVKEAVRGTRFTTAFGKTLKRLLAIAVPITLGAAGLQIINLFDAATVMNRLINAAGYTQERADVVKGVYNYCQTIFNFPCAFIPCITIAIIPAITNSLTLQDRRGVRSVQNSSLRLMGLIAMPCAVGLIVLAEPIVALLGGYTGANLTLATKLMAILGVAVVFNSIVLMTDAIMQAHNHAVIPVVNTLIGGIVKVIVNYILVGNPDIAITGAPVGTIACYAVITVLNLIAMRRVLRRNAPKLLPNLWKTTIAAVLMGGTTWLAYWGLGRIGMGRAVACLGSIVVAVLVYVVLIIVLKVLTYEDCLLLPKGEKIAKILRVR